MNNGAADANQAYGALTEGLYVASFTFERAMGRVLGLLKGDGWRQVGAGFDDVNDFIRSLQFDRFQALAEQRKEFAARVKELQPDISNRAIGDALGVAHTTISRGANAPPSGQEAQENGKSAGANAPPGAVAGRRDALIINNRDMREERREERLEEIARANRELPTGVRYPVVYADPPWRYEHPPNGDSRNVIENHYPTMALEEICALPVNELAAEDAVLYMWATAPKLIECAKVIEAWGFVYRTNLVWIKDKIGMGYYARNQHELLLVARRGDLPPPRPEDRVSSVVHADRTEHSVKPQIFHELIERWYPEQPKIELFSRMARPGWAAWGNQASEAA